MSATTHASHGKGDEVAEGDAMDINGSKAQNNRVRVIDTVAECEVGNDDTKEVLRQNNMVPTLP